MTSLYKPFILILELYYMSNGLTFENFAMLVLLRSLVIIFLRLYLFFIASTLRFLHEYINFRHLRTGGSQFVRFIFNPGAPLV